MIIYTPMQLELVFAGMEEQPITNQRQVVIDNAMLLVEDNGYGGVKVIRLLSSDPQDYLKPEFMPGSQLKL